VDGQDTDALFVQGPNEGNKIPVAGDQDRDINLLIESSLKGINGHGNIRPFFTLMLRHGQILGFNSSVKKVMVPVALKNEVLASGHQNPL